MNKKKIMCAALISVMGRWRCHTASSIHLALCPTGIFFENIHLIFDIEQKSQYWAHTKRTSARD